MVVMVVWAVVPFVYGAGTSGTFSLESDAFSFCDPSRQGLGSCRVGSESCFLLAPGLQSLNRPAVGNGRSSRKPPGEESE